MRHTVKVDYTRFDPEGALCRRLITTSLLLDPYVVSEMGSASIRGLQGDYKKDRTRVAACMKHFIGYSASRNGQDKYVWLC